MKRPTSMVLRQELTDRFQGIVDAIMPKITASLKEKHGSNQIDLATAESHLIRKEVVKIYKDEVARSLNCESLSYPSQIGGEQCLLDSCASFFNRNFKPRVPILPEHIVTGPGVTACLTSILCAICDAGDVVMIPGSYWNGFDLHLKLLPAVHLMNVVLEDPKQDELGLEMIPSLNKAADNLEGEERKLRALIVTNPHNPTGRCYSTETLTSIAKFCQDRDIHLIVDEIYALSQCSRGSIDEHDFTSILSLDLNSIGVNPARVHSIWGTSKDFGSSGVRMGCLISQHNIALRTSVGIVTTTQMPALTSIATAGLLSSPDLPRLIHLNTTRLSRAYIQAKRWMAAYDIPYLPATHGVYILARLDSNAKTWQDEEHVVSALKTAGILVAPGRSFHLREPGWVRITIAVEPRVLKEALSRIAVVLKLDRKGTGREKLDVSYGLSCETRTDDTSGRAKSYKRKRGDDNHLETIKKR